MNKSLQRGLLVFVLIGGITLGFIYREQINTVTLEYWLTDAGVIAPLLLMGLYAVATVLFPAGVSNSIGGWRVIRTDLGNVL